MAGEDGFEQKAVTAEESSSKPTTDGVGTPERCTTEHQAEDQIEEPVSEPQAEAEDQEGYDDEDADLDYEDDADNDGYDDEDDYDYGYDYDSKYEDEDDYDWDSEFAENWPMVRAALLSFPEAANLKPTELNAAVERVLEQSKPEYATCAAPGKIRLLKDDIGLILAQKRQPPITHDLASKGTLYPAELIRRMEELDKQWLPMREKVLDEFEEFQAKVRKDLIEKGYAEVDED